MEHWSQPLALEYSTQEHNDAWASVDTRDFDLTPCLPGAERTMPNMGTERWTEADQWDQSGVV